VQISGGVAHFVRSTTGYGAGKPPAWLARDVADHIWSLEEVIALLD
jgi:biotin transporter BioY